MVHLSFRVPDEVKTRLAERLAASGQSLQAHMTELLSGSLEAPFGSAPRNSLAAVVRTLRGRRDELERRHVAQLWVFGSVARGEERRDSDVDLIVEFVPGAKVSLTAVSSLRVDLESLLGRPVDLAEWRTLRPELLSDVRNDAVAVL